MIHSMQSYKQAYTKGSGTARGSSVVDTSQLTFAHMPKGCPIEADMDQ